MFSRRLSHHLAALSLAATNSTQRTNALITTGLVTVAFASTAAVAVADEAPLNPSEFRSFKVKAVEKLSHNTSKVVLELPATQSLQLPVASCVVIKAPKIGEEGKDVIKPYTPVTSNRDLGHFDFVIKRYPTGKASVFLTDVKPGDSVEVKGPFSKIQYSPNWKKHVGMLAGGSGITPMFQILVEALNNVEDKTKYTLVFANVTEEDILLKQLLDELAKKHANFEVHYVLEKPPQGWTGSVGYISKDLISKLMPSPNDSESIVLVCGPPGMMNAISGNKKSAQDQGELVGILKDLGYQPANVFKF